MYVTDYTALRKLVVSKPYKGGMISVRKMSFTLWIRVSGITRHHNKEIIKLYFENKKGGGADVKSVELSGGRDFALVEFIDQKG